MSKPSTQSKMQPDLIVTYGDNTIVSRHTKFRIYKGDLWSYMSVNATDMTGELKMDVVSVLTLKEGVFKRPRGSVNSNRYFKDLLEQGAVERVGIKAIYYRPWFNHVRALFDTLFNR